MPKRSSKKKPRDVNQIAKRVVDIVSGEEPNVKPDDAADEGKNPHAVALGRMGGLKGGKARASKLSAERRRQIAKRAASKRWGKPKKK